MNNHISTLKELLNYDVSNYYANFFTIKDAYDKGIIEDKYYYDLFSTPCKCGAEMIINSETTILTCANPRCYISQGLQLSEFYSNFGCENIGEETCISIAKYHHVRGIEITSILQLIDIDNLQFRNFLGDSRFNSYKKAYKKIMECKLTFGEFCSNLGIPNISSVMKRVLRRFSTIEELVDKITNNNVKEFLISCGIKDSRKISSFYIHFDDIYLAGVLFRDNMEQQPIIDVPICMTGDVTFGLPIKTKSDFISFINELCVAYDGTPVYRFSLTAGPMKSSFVLSDTRKMSNKLSAALDRQNYLDEQRKYMTTEQSEDTPDILMSTREFYNYLKYIMDIYNKERKEYVSSLVNHVSDCGTSLDNMSLY